ncbi:MAG TPA: hypothetical protein VFN67_36220 [Polyangiales bacterium]|nr:hypothetical protein [Polyangiales bacterium]
MRYLIARGAPLSAIRAVLARVSPTIAEADKFLSTVSLPPAAAPGGGLRVVLSRSYVVGSVALWLAYFMGLVIFYALTNWMPILLGGRRPVRPARDLGIGAVSTGRCGGCFPRAF